MDVAVLQQNLIYKSRSWVRFCERPMLTDPWVRLRPSKATREGHMVKTSLSVFGKHAEPVLGSPHSNVSML